MTEKVALFIDGANVYHSAGSIGLEIDFSRLLSFFQRDDKRILRSFYYTALITEDGGMVKRHKQVTWLSHNGFSVVTKPAKVYDKNGVRRVKGNMDMEMAVDMLKMAHLLDRIILFTGDGDFTPMMRYIQETHGTQFTVVSTLKSHPVMIADELRRQADQYIDLDSIRNEIQSRRVRPLDAEVPLVTLLGRAGE